MRLGKKLRKSHGWKKAGTYGKPKFISAETVVGQVSPDLTASVYGPKLKALAGETLMQFAEDCLLYDEAMKVYQSSLNEAQIEFDGTETLPPEPVYPPEPVWKSQFVVDEFANSVLTDNSDYFFGRSATWKMAANAAKFERYMEERYGVFRPFVRDNPWLEEFIRSTQRKYATGYFSPLRQGDPPIPRSTAIIILFMMQRGGVKWDVMLLSALFFLVGLQPWALVAMVIAGHALLWRRKSTRLGKMPASIPAVESYHAGMDKKEKYDTLLQPVGTELGASETIDMSQFDAIVLGAGPCTLYTAALLSRAGRKVLVLSDRTDASGCLTLVSLEKKLEQYKAIPFDVDASNVAKISQQQKVLVPALCTTTDFQGGVRFAKVGSTADNHAFEVISIPGVGTDNYETDNFFVMTGDAAKQQIMDDAAALLGDGWPGLDGTEGNSSSGAYMKACEQINTTSTSYYLSKLFPDNVNELRKTTVYGESAIRYVGSLLNRSFPLNTHVRSLMAGLGMKIENIRPKNTSLAAHITHLCASTSGDGMHYPIGGPRALCHALANVTLRNGGEIRTGVEIKELLFEKTDNASTTAEKPKDDGKNEGPPCPRCVGVRLHDGREVRFATETYSSDSSTDPAIVSMHGFINTYIKLLPDEIRTEYRVPRGLPALAESRPVFKFLVLLDGNASDLELSGADYYRLPNAARAIDEIDHASGNIKFGEIGFTDESHEEEGDKTEISETINEESVATVDSNPTKNASSRPKGLLFGQGPSWIHISFPSAKDPSFKERHGDISTCVVTIEADDDFVTLFDTKPKLFAPKSKTIDKISASRLGEKVLKELVRIFPQLNGKILHSELRGVIHRGLSHTPERYAAQGIRPSSPFPCLYTGGADLTVGESFSAAIVSGWLVTNAILGYSFLDLLFLQKSATSDIEQFLEEPEIYEEEDLAVPYFGEKEEDDRAAEDVLADENIPSAEQNSNT